MTKECIIVCPFDKFCLDQKCTFAHSLALCRDKDKCCSYFCKFRHSNNRQLICTAGSNCVAQSSTNTGKEGAICKYLHPQEKDYCKFKETCFTKDCRKRHTRGFCSENCNEYECGKRHPKERVKCNKGSECKNMIKCGRVHPATPPENLVN